MRNTLRLQVARDPVYLDLYDEQVELELVYEQYSTAVKPDSETEKLSLLSLH